MQRILTLVLAVALVAAAGLAAATVQAAEPSRPNIIYILLDDAGYGDLSCYGQTRFQTPNIDRMARQGLRFTQHYAGCTVCAPTRSVLMQGVHTGHSYVRGNREVRPEGQEPLPAGTVTVARLLQQAGYATGAFGKWGLGSPGSTGDPTRQGFDVFFGYNCQREAHSYYPSHLWSNTHKIPLDGQTYAHDLIMERALGFIRENRQRPFFCYLPVTIPHAAMHVPEAYAAPFREKFPQFEDKIGRYRGPEVRNPVAAFAGMMSKLDEDVGRLLKLLDELDLDERTLVMLSSDNGPHKEGGHDPVFFDSNGPLTGFKRDLTEGGIRVPLIARWPGRIAAGGESDLISAHWDMLPTFCELAGAKTPDNLDGISLTATLFGQPDAQQQHAYLYWEFYERGGKRAARFGKWKAIQQGLQQATPGPIQVFDLESDLAEQHDLADQHPEIVRRAREIFAEAHEPSPLWQFRALTVK